MSSLNRYWTQRVHSKHAGVTKGYCVEFLTDDNERTYVYESADGKVRGTTTHGLTVRNELLEYHDDGEPLYFNMMCWVDVPNGELREI